MFLFDFCGCDKTLSKPIKVFTWFMGSSSREVKEENEGRNLEAVTEAQITEEYCLLACFNAHSATFS